MQPTMQYTHTVHAMETDLFGQWSLRSVFYHLQEIAGMHATALGVSREKAGIPHMAWVIARMTVQVHRYPRAGERVDVVTWPGPPDRISYPRHYRITGEQGEVLAEGTSIWMIIHTETRKFRFPKEFNFPFPDTSMLPPPLPSPERILLFEDVLPQTSTRRPYVSELDGNAHMNNTQYAKWICDLFSPALLAEKEIACLQINYVNEILWGQDITLELQQKEDAFVVTGRIDKKICFQAKGTLRSKK